MTPDISIRAQLYRQAIILAQITVFYNFAEGMISILLGLEDETLSLFGFGLDSFVEVISGIGIWHMVLRQRQNPDSSRDRFERRALQVTGSAFYFLTAILVVTSVVNLIQNHHPETTFWGAVVALVSILTMWLLIHYKMQVGGELGSEAIIADAKCTRACLQLSVVLLISSIGYELTGIGGIDALGSLLIAGLAFREGREAFAKSSGDARCSCADKGCSES